MWGERRSSDSRSAWCRSGTPSWQPRRCVATPARGVRAVAFSELPTYLDLPSLYTGYWDPFFAACEETGTVVCMHIGSGTKTPQASPDGPDAVAATILFGNSVASLTDLLFSGTLHRFPGLAPACTPRRRSAGSPTCSSGPTTSGRPTGAGATRSVHCPEPPPSYYRRGNVVSCFFKDPVGVALLDRIGLDNVVFETDYPHSDSTWPDSRRAAAEQFGHLDAVAIEKIARGNAIRLLGPRPGGAEVWTDGAASAQQEAQTRGGDPEHVGRQGPAELGGVPARSSGRDLGRLAPAVHPDDPVVDGTEHLAGDHLGPVTGQPGHEGGAVRRVHRLPFVVGYLVGLDDRGGRGMVPVSRVAPAGPTALAVTP